MSRETDMLIDRIHEMAEVRHLPQIVRIPFTDGELNDILEAASSRQIYTPSLNQIDSWALIVGLTADLRSARTTTED